MQWGHFVSCSSNQNRESTAFELILRSACEPSSSGKQVGRNSTARWKKGQVWGRESEWWPNYICNRVASVGNGKNFEKQAQSSKG